MAPGALAAPGTLYGPCVEDCAHVDCAETRELAARPCAVCDRPVGWETRFYQVSHADQEGAPVYAHATCWEEERR